ncbi:unnamed protein product [marine sediment metagenome]|uniref:Uncharacterized protein n=1 Tax=marine sediment metagenome TaxID=412755 RepID=X1K1M2_9ZZZZ
MVGKISVDDLPDEVLEKIGLKEANHKAPKAVKSSVVAMGGVLLALKGLTNREALWVLRQATVIVRGYRKDKEPRLGKKRNCKGNKGWKREKTVDKRQQIL